MKAATPTNDKTLPSFLHPAYLDVQSDLQLVADIWNDLKDCKRNYLPQEEAEPPKAYSNRLDRTQFDNRFTPALKGHAGLLSEFTLQDVAATVEEFQEDIDLQGSDITTFFTELDEMVLRDGGAGILVEHPPEPRDEEGNPLIQSAADQQQFGLRPYLVAVDRRAILNWDIEYRQGKPFIKRLVIREVRELPDGDFGTEERVLYRVLRPGSFEVYEIRAIDGGKFTKVLIPELSGFTGLDQVPFIWYSVSESKWFKSQIPFLNLARLNVEHYQKRSGLNEVLHKCNLPVPVRKGLIKNVADLAKAIAKLIIGPNSVVDVPTDGDFYFAEPTGNAIAASQADIEKLEASMDRVSLAFLSGGEVSARTATEVVMDSSQTQCSLKNMARRKESIVQQVFDLWIKYTGEDSGGTVKINESVLQAPATPQEVQIILDAMGIKISNRMGLQMLIQRKWLPADTDLDAELQQLEGLNEERQTALATAASIQAEASKQQPVAA